MEQVKIFTGGSCGEPLETEVNKWLSEQPSDVTIVSIRLSSSGTSVLGTVEFRNTIVIHYRIQKFV